MPCQCQLCPSTDATVHLTEPLPGGFRELHLCRSCVARLHLVLEPPPSIQAILAAQAASELGVTPGSPATAALERSSQKDPVCASCGLTWSAYQEHHLLGCGECWLAFRSRLDPLLERYHGHTLHSGRVPGAVSTSAAVRKVTRRRAKSSLQNQLKAALAKAVAAEEYLEAAKLRDQIAALAGQETDESQPGSQS
jgi:protein arginine kinase activator